jgi:hypothetical protein
LNKRRVERQRGYLSALLPFELIEPLIEILLETRPRVWWKFFSPRTKKILSNPADWKDIPVTVESLYVDEPVPELKWIETAWVRGEPETDELDLSKPWPNIHKLLSSAVVCEFVNPEFCDTNLESLLLKCVLSEPYQRARRLFLASH